MLDRVSFDINPSSGHILQTLADKGYLTELVGAGARTHQPGCNGCIGMGQAPVAGRISLHGAANNFLLVKNSNLNPSKEQNMTQKTVAEVFVETLIAAAVIGLLSAWIPARAASKMNIVEALRMVA